MEQKKLSVQLVETKFGLEFIKVLVPLTGKHLKVFLENKGTNYRGLLKTIVKNIFLNKFK